MQPARTTMWVLGLTGGALLTIATVPAHGQVERFINSSEAKSVGIAGGEGACCNSTTGECRQETSSECYEQGNIFHGIGEWCGIGCENNPFTSCAQDADCPACKGGESPGSWCDCPGGGTCTGANDTCEGGDSHGGPCVPFWDCGSGTCSGFSTCEDFLHLCVGACCNDVTGECLELPVCTGGAQDGQDCTGPEDRAACLADGGICETECPAGYIWDGFGTHCDPNCCEQPDQTGGDECDEAPVHPITVPSLGEPPVTVTITGNSSDATGQDRCIAVDPDAVWWEVFQIDKCADVTIDSCCNDPVVPFANALTTDCPCRCLLPGEALSECIEGNPRAQWRDLPSGPYYYQIPKDIGVYQMHISVEACAVAACCLEAGCAVLRRPDCDAAGGRWVEDWVVCNPDPCAQPLAQELPQRITQIIDPDGDGMNSLARTRGIAEDGSKNVYVTGRVTNDAFRITPGDGITEIIDETGDGTHALSSPGEIAVDSSSGDVYISGQGSDNAFGIAPNAAFGQDRPAYAKVYSARIAPDPPGTLAQVEQIARQRGSVELLTLQGDGNPCTPRTRELLHLGDPGFGYPGFSVRSQDFLAREQAAGNVAMADGGKTARGSSEFAGHNIDIEWTFPDNADAPVFVSYSVSGSEIIKESIHPVIGSVDPLARPHIIRVAGLDADGEIIQVFDYFDTRPPGEPEVHRLSAPSRFSSSSSPDHVERVPGGSSSFEPDSASSAGVCDTVDFGNPTWPPGDPGLHFDSGWQPGGTRGDFPLQGHVSADAGASIKAHVKGSFCLDPSSPGNLCAGSASGYKELDVGVDGTVQGSLYVTLDMPYPFDDIEIDKQFDIAALPADFQINDKEEFSSFLLGGSCAEASDTATYSICAFPDISVPGLGGNACFDVGLQGRCEICGSSISVSDNNEFTSEGECQTIAGGGCDGYLQTASYKASANWTVGAYFGLNIWFKILTWKWQIAPDFVFDILSGTKPDLALAFDEPALSFAPECDDNGESATCDSDCTWVVCGDGMHNTTAGEFCDDGYTDACGTCNADCTCSGDGSECGDGERCPETEQCDDGRHCEDGTDCSGNPTECDGIGDGICSRRSGDGCDAKCMVEPGWRCAGDPRSTCECAVRANAPEPERLPEEGQPVNAKNRFLSIRTNDFEREQAIRVRFVNLPPPFDVWNNMDFFVGEPRQVCENSGRVNPPSCGSVVAGKCPDAPYGACVTDTDCCAFVLWFAAGWFWAAPLECRDVSDPDDLPYFMDWRGQCVDGVCVGGLNDGSACTSHIGCIEVVHIFHEGIVPGGVYDVQVVDSSCALEEESSYSVPLTMTQAKWGDVCGPGPGGACSAVADGTVDVANDVLGVLEKFVNFSDLQKARADLEPAALDLKVNVANDVLFAIDAFAGVPYPFAPGDPCGPGPAAR